MRLLFCIYFCCSVINNCLGTNLKERFRNFANTLSNITCEKNSNNINAITISICRPNETKPNKNRKINRVEFVKLLLILLRILRTDDEQNIPEQLQVMLLEILERNDEQIKKQLMNTYVDICQKTKHISKKSDEPYIIVLEEMFFGQETPLNEQEKNDILRRFNTLSQFFKNAIFYVNILYKRNNIENLMNIRDINITKQDRFVFEDIALKSVYFEKLKNLTGSENVDVVANESFCIQGGRILTKYKKSSYFKEADGNLVKETTGFFSKKTFTLNGIYDIGADVDEIVTSGNQLSELLHKNVSSQICFDLAKNTRGDLASFKNNVPAHQSILHIIQSNVIDILTRDNLKNLPTGRIIVQSDKLVSDSCVDMLKNVTIKSREDGIVTDGVRILKQDFKYQSCHNGKPVYSIIGSIYSVNGD